MASNMESYYLFLSMMNYFSLADCSKSEYDIIVELINRTANFCNYLSLEEFSSSSHVSQPTISRFVKKLGFKNYQEFNMNFFSSIAIAQQIRNNKYRFESLEQAIENNYATSLANLASTKDNLDLDLLKKIIDSIKNAKSSVFFGTPESIVHFSRFQRDLVVNSHPSFFFYDSNSQAEHLKLIDSDSCAIFIVLANEYLSLYRGRIEFLKNQGTTLILFTQDNKDELDNQFDYIYQYGTAGSFRFGDYSLPYIASILSAILVDSIDR